MVLFVMKAIKLVVLRSKGHGGETKPWARRQEMYVGSKFTLKQYSHCAFGEATPLLGTPLSSCENGERSPCFPIKLSCDAKAMSVKKLCFCVMILKWHGGGCGVLMVMETV